MKGFFASCTVNQSVVANVCHGTSAETPESVHHQSATSASTKNTIDHAVPTEVFCLYFLCAHPKCSADATVGPVKVHHPPQVCYTVVAALMRWVDKSISMLFTASIPILKNPFHGPLARALSDQVDEKTTSATVSLRFLRATANFANSILHTLVFPAGWWATFVHHHHGLSVCWPSRKSRSTAGSHSPQHESQPKHNPYVLARSLPDTDHIQLNLMCVRSDHPVLHPENSQVDRRSWRELVENSLPVPWMTSSARGQVCVSSGTTSSK